MNIWALLGLLFFLVFTQFFTLGPTSPLTNNLTFTELQDKKLHFINKNSNPSRALVFLLCHVCGVPLTAPTLIIN